VVLQSFPAPLPTTNPYLVMLRDSLDALDDVEVLTFSWKRALAGHYSVFHVHWPEALIAARGSRLKAFVRQCLFAALLVRLRLGRTPLVRTVHNLDLPSGISRREALLLRWADRWTTARISINEATALDARTPSVTVPLGHYRDWFGTHPRAQSLPGRLTFFGLVRRYKGLDGLVAAFAETEGRSTGLSLRIAGSPSSDDLAEMLRGAAAVDPRMSLDLTFLEDADVVTEVTQAELVVLPYKVMHNSAGVLTALSLERPVLVPDNDANRRLAAEVGPGWIHRYSGELTGDDLLDALTSVRAAPPAAPPDLSRRGWDRAGDGHRTAYRLALAAVGRAAG
jgi:glycosyltransferase involved in cell wall biosynthesis